MLTRSADPITNRNFVDTTPNSWYYDEGALYVNTSGVNPAASSSVYTGAVREDVVFSNAQSNLVFRDLVVDESAKYNSGYAFRVEFSNNVRIENSEAYRAGKHHFGVIESDDFVGTGLKAAVAMPDQGYGGATAFVAFSDNRRVGDDSSWIDCVAGNLGSGYLAFYTHGEGIGDIVLQNLKGSEGAGIAISTDAPGAQDVRILGGHLDNAGISIYGEGVLVDGIRITGPSSNIDLRGNDNTIQNVLMTGANPNHSYYSAILDQGRRNTLQFNTVLLDPTSPFHATALAILNAATETRLHGNIFNAPHAILRQWFQGVGSIQSDFNLYSPEAYVILRETWRTLAQWQAMGYDLQTLAEAADFVDPSSGNFGLLDGSPAIDAIDWNAFANMPLFDFLGDNRPAGSRIRPRHLRTGSSRAEPRDRPIVCRICRRTPAPQ